MYTGKKESGSRQGLTQQDVRTTEQIIPPWCNGRHPLRSAPLLFFTPWLLPSLPPVTTASHCMLTPIRRTLTPPPLWHTTFRHVLVSAGADRWLRWWDVHEGRLLAVQFTGHAAGENLPGLAVSPDNSTLVTGDTAGYVMVRGGGVVVR